MTGDEIQQLLTLLDGIEAELKASGYWRSVPPATTVPTHMSESEFLTHEYLPNAREFLKKGQLPPAGDAPNWLQNLRPFPIAQDLVQKIWEFQRAVNAATPGWKFEPWRETQDYFRLTIQVTAEEVNAVYERLWAKLGEGLKINDPRTKDGLFARVEGAFEDELFQGAFQRFIRSFELPEDTHGIYFRGEKPQRERKFAYFAFIRVPRGFTFPPAAAARASSYGEFHDGENAATEYWRGAEFAKQRLTLDWNAAGPGPNRDNPSTPAEILQALEMELKEAGFWKAARPKGAPSALFPDEYLQFVFLPEERESWGRGSPPAAGRAEALDFLRLYGDLARAEATIALLAAYGAAVKKAAPGQIGPPAAGENAFRLTLTVGAHTVDSVFDMVAGNLVDGLRDKEIPLSRPALHVAKLLAPEQQIERVSAELTLGAFAGAMEQFGLVDPVRAFFEYQLPVEERKFSFFAYVSLPAGFVFPPQARAESIPSEVFDRGFPLASRRWPGMAAYKSSCAWPGRENTYKIVPQPRLVKPSPSPTNIPWIGA